MKEVLCDIIRRRGAWGRLPILIYGYPNVFVSLPPQNLPKNPLRLSKPTFPTMLSTVTLIRDSKKFILPHFKMYEGLKNFGLLVDNSIIGGAIGHDKPDNSESLVKKFFPDTVISHTGKNVWGSDIFNEMISLVDCTAPGSKVIMLHADVVLDKKNFKLLKDFILETDYDIYKVDMRKCWINYYVDLDHGTRDCLDTEPVAVKSTTRFRNFYDHLIGEKEVIIDFITGHHFCGWKGDGIKSPLTKDWFSSPAAHAAAPNGWTSSPQEIKDMFSLYANSV